MSKTTTREIKPIFPFLPLPEFIVLDQDEKIFFHQGATGIAPLLRQGILSMAISLPLAAILILLKVETFLILMVIGPTISICILGAVINTFSWRGYRFLITNKRIVIYQKFIEKQKNEIPLERIIDVVIIQGPFGRIADYGTIKPLTAGYEDINSASQPGTSALVNIREITDIKSPWKVYALLQELIQAKKFELQIEIPPVLKREAISADVPKEISLLDSEKVIFVRKRTYASAIMNIFTLFLALATATMQIISSADMFEFLVTHYSIVVVVGIYIIIGIIILSLIYMAIAVCYARGHIYVFTDFRVFIYRKFIWLSIRDSFYRSVTNVVKRVPFWGRSLHYEGLHIITPGTEMRFRMFVLNPVGMRTPTDEIERYIREYSAPSS